MKILQKFFIVTFFICLIILGCFIYVDFVKPWLAKNKTVTKNTSKTSIFKDDGKIHIVIDAGHGGNDVGAIGVLKNKSIIYEKNIARKVVDIVMSMVDTSRYTVIETRLGDSNTHRHNRMLLAKQFKPNLLVSFHCNSFTNKNWNGTEIHICDSTLSLKDTTSILNPFNTINKGFADTLLKNIAIAFPKLRSDKVVSRKDRIWMIYAGNFPSVLIEWGYISNKNDVEIMQDPLAQQVLATTVWKCINQHFGFEK